jgi:hypothetical protein
LTSYLVPEELDLAIALFMMIHRDLNIMSQRLMSQADTERDAFDALDPREISRQTMESDKDRGALLPMPIKHNSVKACVTEIPDSHGLASIYKKGIEYHACNQK